VSKDRHRIFEDLALMSASKTGKTPTVDEIFEAHKKMALTDPVHRKNTCLALGIENPTDQQLTSHWFSHAAKAFEAQLLQNG
jgi:hypothetical protein